MRRHCNFWRHIHEYHGDRILCGEPKQAFAPTAYIPEIYIKHMV